MYSLEKEAPDPHELQQEFDQLCRTSPLAGLIKAVGIDQYDEFRRLNPELHAGKVHILSGLTFNDESLSGVDFSKVIFNNCSLKNCVFTHCNFSSKCFSTLGFDGCEFVDCEFGSAKIVFSDISHSTFTFSKKATDVMKIILVCTDAARRSGHFDKQLKANLAQIGIKGDVVRKGR